MDPRRMAIAAFAIAAVLCIGALFHWLNGRFKKLSEQFFHPLEDDVPRAQQIHPTIERCEADLVDGTQHMFSLTELRGPRWWSAWCIRLALRIVTFGADETPRSAQVYGVDPVTVREAVRIIVAEDRADHVDLNVGGTVPKVTRKGGG